MPKSWYIFCLFFVLFQFLFWLKDRETMPFYLYGMYSSPMAAKSKLVTHWDIKINGEQLDWTTLPNLARVHLRNNFQEYDDLLSSEYVEHLEQNLKQQFSKIRMATYMPFIAQQLLSQPIGAKAFKVWLIKFLQPYVYNNIQDIVVIKQVIKIEKGIFSKLQPIILF